MSQVNGPTYLVREIKTNTLNPFSRSRQFNVENPCDLKASQKNFSVDLNDIQASLGVAGLYLNIPILKVLERVQGRLLNDSTLSDQTHWNTDDIINLLDFFLETYFIFSRLMEHRQKMPSGHIAEIFMIQFEEEYTFNESNEFLLYLKT